MDNQPEQPNISQEPQPTIQPEIPQKPSLPTWLIILITILAISVVSVGVYAAYQYYYSVCCSEPTQPSDQETISPGTLPTGEINDETTNWQTYRNEEYGFEMKYPLSWQVKQIDSDFKFSNKDKVYNIEMSSVIPITISVKDNSYNDSIDKYLVNDQIKKILKDETVLIGGKKAYIIQGITPPVCHDFRVIFASDKVFNISSNACIIKAVNQDDFNEIDEIFNQILFTFKFIK